MANGHLLKVCLAKRISLASFVLTLFYSVARSRMLSFCWVKKIGYIHIWDTPRCEAIGVDRYLQYSLPNIYVNAFHKLNLELQI